jgi:hypothetical protein
LTSISTWPELLYPALYSKTALDDAGNSTPIPRRVYLIVLNDVHLRRLIRDYISYYHRHPIHDSLEKDTPAMRPVSSKPSPSALLVSFPHMGGLHHRYDWHRRLPEEIVRLRLEICGTRKWVCDS